MTNNEDKVLYINHDVYYDGRGKICPVCGGKIIHPYIGLVTSEQLDEESKCCTWGEVIDEGDSTIGFVPQCKNIHPYTLASEEHKHVHYDLVEMVNCWDMPLSEKIEKVTDYLIFLFKDDNVKKEDIIFDVQNNKIVSIRFIQNIKNLTIDINIDKDGNIGFSRAK